MKDESSDDDEFRALGDDVGRDGMRFWWAACGFDGGADGFSVTKDFYFENIARLVSGGNEVAEGDSAVVGIIVVGIGVDVLSVDLNNDIAFLDSGLVGWTVFEDGGHVNASFDIRDFEEVTELGVAGGGEGHAAFCKAEIGSVGDVSEEVSGYRS